MKDLRRPAMRARGTMCCLLILLLSAAAMAASASAQPDSAASVKPQLDEARTLLERRQFQAAADAFSRANDAAGGHCGACLLGLARALLPLRGLDAAIAATRQAIAALPGDPLLGRAECNLGYLLLARASTHPEAAAEAEEAYGKALAADVTDRAEALGGIAKARWRTPPASGPARSDPRSAWRDEARTRC